MIVPMTMMCTHRPRVYPVQLKNAINHAKLLCLGYEDTEECKNALKRVEYLEKLYVDQEKVDAIIREEMLSKREYDI
jgi:hypothetical protein